MLRMVCLFLFTVGVLAQDHPGKPVYQKYCEQCHGDKGDGRGYAYDFVLPKPRDFTTGVFKFRGTPDGYLPTENDLIRIIRDGIPGTSMPAFSHIGDTSIKDAADYIKIFFKDRIEKDTRDGYWPPKTVDTGTPPKVTAKMIEDGRQIYLENGCADCHGFAGKADGPSSPTLKDDYDNPIKPANLTAGWRFRAGHELSKIYLAFTTGLSGTPMPSYMDSLSDEKRWSLSAYVQSLSSGVLPNTSPQVIAPRIEGSLPDQMDDPRWAETERAYFPLTAQVIWEPINTNPTVFDVKVRAMHNGEEIALLLEWDDPTFSSTAVAQTVQPAGEEDDFWAEEEDEAAGDDMDDFFGDEEESEKPITILNDAFAIQFPSGIPKTNEKPYFVMGDGKSPVNLWRWTNGDAVEAVPFSGEDTDPWKKYYTEYAGSPNLSNQFAKGRDNISDLPGEALSGKVRYLNGTYSLLVKRGLASAETKDTQLAAGQFIPISFWAWDGHHGEEGLNASLSSWYWLVLEEPIDQSAYYKIAIAVALMLVFQILAIRSAKKKAAAPADDQDLPPEQEMEPAS